MLDNQLPPGGNSLYGEAITKNVSYAWTANIHYNTDKYGNINYNSIRWTWLIRSKAAIGGGYFRQYDASWYQWYDQRGPANEIRNEQMSGVGLFNVFERYSAARMTIQY